METPYSHSMNTELILNSIYALYILLVGKYFKEFAIGIVKAFTHFRNVSLHCSHSIYSKIRGGTGTGTTRAY